jgi:hypothetical protein
MFGFRPAPYPSSDSEKAWTRSLGIAGPFVETRGPGHGLRSLLTVADDVGSDTAATVTPALGAVISTFSDSSTHPRDLVPVPPLKPS